MNNCKGCKWLNYYDGYLCGNGQLGSNENEFINDIEKEVCQNYKERIGKFWLNVDGEF